MIKSKLIESKVITENSDFNIDILKNLLNKKFREINYANAKEDVMTFIEDKDSLDLWNSEFFIEISKNLKG